MTDDQTASKVVAVTAGFWVIKVLATTFGETAGDTVTMTLNLGYLAGTLIFLGALAVLVTLQISARRFHSWLFWATIVASTTAGTTLADFADRSLGIGYAGGASLLLVSVLAVLALWRFTCGSVSVSTVTGPKTEGFYWATITLSQTLGTALGDWAADTGGLGYGGGVAVFALALAAVAGVHFFTRVSKVALFWTAFILTRPLGATVGDLLDKPSAEGGLDLSRPLASLVIAAAMILLILTIPQRAGSHPQLSKAQSS